MHGIIFNQFQKFTRDLAGPSAWLTLLGAQGLSRKIYLPTQIYPDEELISLVTGVASQQQKPVEEILEEFGRFIVADLLKVYSAMIRPEWRTLDVLEHTENTMHKAVRHSDRNATPPELLCTRVSFREVIIDYSSRRQLSSLGVGIIKGISAYYGEKTSIQVRHYQTATGEKACKINVVLL
jgi:hypothetical protein